MALEVEAAPRVEWESFDLSYQGKPIEVKSSSFLQAWAQSMPSTIRFDIKKRRWGWVAKTGTWNEPEKPKRFALIYVFALFTENDLRRADVLDTSQWTFFVLSRQDIDEQLGEQKSIGLARLSGLTRPLEFVEIKSAVDEELKRAGTK